MMYTFELKTVKPVFNSIKLLINTAYDYVHAISWTRSIVYTVLIMATTQ